MNDLVNKSWDLVNDLVNDTISRHDVLRLLDAVPSEEFATKAMLISGVNALPPAQPSVSKEEMVGDTISRQAAIDALFELYEYQRDIDPTEAADLVRQGIYLAEKKIEQLPSVQPEIIRCKDCKYNATSKKCLNPNSFFLVPADDDYCSYAERRTDD